MNPRYAPMFAPYTLNNGVAIKNRFVVAPLTIYESDANGGLTDAQIAHAGGRANPLMTRGLGAVAPSAYGRVREMSSNEVAQMVQHFARAAELALDAGLDGVEIHGANGWLIQ